MPDRFVKLIATFFYIGYLPLAPGSVASIAGVMIYVLFQANAVVYAGLLATVIFLGFRVSDRMEELVGSKDPSCIVIDEVAGIMISFWGLPWHWSVIITAYFVFRAFDMFKIYPVNRLEDMKGGVGVMMDDIIAGVYTWVTMHLAVRMAGLV
jgi:phosphatidylglycerophosphatase A